MPPSRLFDHGSCLDGWISSVPLWQEVLGKDVFNAEVKEAVAEVLFHPRHHFHFLAPGLLLPGRHLHQGGGENDCGAHLSSGFQSARSKFHKWLGESCVLKCYISQGGWHGWRRFQLAKKEPESRHQHCFYFQFLSTHPNKNLKIIQRKHQKCFSPQNLQLAHLFLLCF